MGVDLEEDIKRRPIELNLRAARKRQSPQTGYVHHCYEAIDGEKTDTIPIFENFCFALALLRSRQSENMLEGIELIKKLLHFECEGNFPVYLHEFPNCKDRLLSVKLFSVFPILLAEFHAILDASLKMKLEQLIGRILSLGYKTSSIYSLPIKAYFEPQNLPALMPASPEHMAVALIAVGIARTRGHSVSIDAILNTWHPTLFTFKGPQEQEKGEPKPTLFDFFLSDYHKSYPARLLLDHPIHLRAALVYPLEKKEHSAPAAIPYQVQQPCILYWGSAQHLHSLVLDFKEAQFEIKETEYILTLTKFKEDAPIEVAFFCNLHPDHTLRVNGQKATTFQLGDTVEIASQGHRFCMQFFLEEGEGAFFGQVSRANRPMQLAAKGSNRYEAYDLQIGLRTVRRSERCSIKVKLVATGF